MALVAGLALLAMVAPALAWEFEMKGEYEYRFRYWARMGTTDLYGNADLQNAGGPAMGFAGPDIYGSGAVRAVPADGAAGANMRVTRGGFSAYESDALCLDSRLTLYPTIRACPAIRVHGVYNVGGYRNKYTQYDLKLAGATDAVTGLATPFTYGVGMPPFERYYVHSMRSASYETAAVGSWEQFRATIQLPWGILSIGAKDFPLGTGTITAFSTASESLLWVVPYGPFRFLWAIYPAQASALHGPFGSWNYRPDGGTKPSYFQGYIATYDSGPITAGGGTILQAAHADKGYTGTFGADATLGFYLAYFKYNNGTVFANAEYSWVDLGIHFLGAAPSFAERYHAMAEVGAAFGPAKATLAWFQASGPVLNTGNPTKAYADYPINYQATEPYQYLMGQVYAGGTNSYSGLLLPGDGNGMLGDMYAFAGRMDYAVASNLNAWASYFWASRLEQNGWWFGHFNSDGTTASAASRAAFRALNGRAAGNPFVDKGFVGWELNLGLDWKLLEGMTFKGRYAYWQPGEWFYQAYQAVGTSGGAVVTNALVTGRSPIQAFTGSLLIEF